MQGAIVFPVAVFTAGLVLSAQMGTAKPEYTRKTRLECEYCHPPNERTLNEAGEYYRTHRYRWDGYKPPPGKETPEQAAAKKK